MEKLVGSMITNIGKWNTVTELPLAEVRELRGFFIVSLDAKTSEIILVKDGRKAKFWLLMPQCKLQKTAGGSYGVGLSDEGPWLVDPTLVCEGKQTTLNAVLASLDDNKPLHLLVWRNWIIEAKRVET